MKDGTLAENHSGLAIRLPEPKNQSGEVVSENNLPLGYKIERDGITLEIKKYVKRNKGAEGYRAICYCSVCGQIVPALKMYTEKMLSDWLECHINLFLQDHGVKNVK